MLAEFFWMQWLISEEQSFICLAFSWKNDFSKRYDGYSNYASGLFLWILTLLSKSQTMQNNCWEYPLIITKGVYLPPVILDWHQKLKHLEYKVPTLNFWALNCCLTLKLCGCSKQKHDCKAVSKFLRHNAKTMCLFPGHSLN